MKIGPELDYADAHGSQFTRIMGVRLLPLRAGHKLILQQARSPFFETTKSFGVADLIFALWVCSRPYTEARKWRVRRMSIAWELWSIWIAVRCVLDEDLFWSRVALFFDYIKESNARPIQMRVKKTDSGEEPEITLAPALMILKRDLMGKIVFSEDEFFELPIRQAHYERYAQLEKDGTVAWPEGWEVGL